MESNPNSVDSAMQQAANPAGPAGPNPNQQLKQSKGVPAKGYYFETQTKRLKQYYLEHQKQLVGRKVLFNNSAGMVRYFGPLVHEGKPANSTNESWIGIEWEEDNRGKHDGSVKGHEYFKCAANQGSLIKYEKIEFGYRLEIAMFKRYFKSEELHHAKDIYDNLNQIKDQIKKEEETTPEEDKEAIIKKAITKKIHKIEYDAEAYLDTVKQSKKILIQFVGFDQIWHKINHLDKLQSVSLADCRIWDLGPLGHMNSLLKSLRVLSLEDNLLSDWNQIYQLGYELPLLNELSVSGNRLSEPEKSFEDMEQVFITGREELFYLKETQLFKNLRTLILIKTGLTWKTFFKVLPVFRNVHEFILCKNNLSDTENIDSTKLDYLEETRFLNLEQTRLMQFSDLHPFSKLPKLEKLILNRNELKSIKKDLTGFSSLKHLSVQFCALEKPVALARFAELKSIESFNVKHNPMGDKLGHGYIRMRAVAEFPNLIVINGAWLKKVERKDFEIYYLRETFREYFIFKGVPDYNYDYEDFLKYCDINHPNIPRLIKKYGNPYEVQEKQEIQNKIKEQVKATENKKGTGMVQVFIENKENGANTSKKIPLSWTVSSLRNFFVKTTMIPVNEIILTCYAEESSSGEVMTEDHKNLGFYELMNGSRIVIERKSK